MKMRKVNGALATILKAGMLTILLGSTAYADWYKVKVVQVVPRTATGDVFVQLLPGDTETRFTEIARGILLGTESGTNKVMAVMLTAVALKSEITVQMANVPAWNPAQVITSAGIGVSE